MNSRISTQSALTVTTKQDACPRCKGLMVPGISGDPLPEIYKGTSTLSWRCVNCGEWVDPTVMANRQSRKEITVAVSCPAR